MDERPRAKGIRGPCHNRRRLIRDGHVALQARAPVKARAAARTSDSRRLCGLAPPPEAVSMRPQAPAQQDRRAEAEEEEAQMEEAEGEEAAGPPPPRLWASTIVIGSFAHRTRTRTAEAEVLEIIGELGLAHVFEDFAPSAPTCTVLRAQLCDFNAVTEMSAAFRTVNVQAAHSVGPLWAQRARSAEEAARTAPVARGVRVLRDHLEYMETREIQAEGHYRRDEESIYVTKDDWASESLLITKSQTTGAWVINSELWPELGIRGSA